ncbi:MAG: c-type cytochrome biogenesis protein CcmI [Pseudomonadota bacterium]
MFWLIAIALTLIVCAPLALALVRGTGGDVAALKDMALYKDQLKEIDRDLARGTLAQEEAEAAKTEVARRLLAADKRAQAEADGETASGQAKTLGFVLIAVMALFGGALYMKLGTPGYQDMPLQARLDAVRERNEKRPRQAQMEAITPAPTAPQLDEDSQALLNQLRAALADRPNDVRGLRLLASQEARLGNFRAAHAAQTQLIETLRDNATAKDWVDLAEFMIYATQGYVSPEAENALTVALQKDPRDHRARYYSGLTLVQSGRPDIAYRVWVGLLQESAPTDPWVPHIQSQINRVALAAGIPLTDPTMVGPDALAVQEAEALSPAERQEMIRGMVSGLAERLDDGGGTAAEWARLIRAYGVLGETARASETWKKAQTAFAGDSVSLALLREAARAAEVAQ